LIEIKFFNVYFEHKLKPNKMVTEAVFFVGCASAVLL